MSEETMGVIIMIGFFLFISSLVLGLIYFGANAEVKQTCMKSNKTYFNADGIEFCGDINQMNDLFKQIRGNLS